MKADELVALAAAHGIDLVHVAGNASDLKGPARPRRRNPRELRSGIPVHMTVQGAGSHVYRRPAWTSAELAQAAHGVPRMPWLAACYSFAGDASGYKELHRGLMHQALQISEREEWPWRVRGRDGSQRFYIAELAQLVLDVERERHLFVEWPALHAACMGVDEPVWNAMLAIRYTALQLKYERWLGVARGMIQRWLRPEEEVERELGPVAPTPANALGSAATSLARSRLPTIGLPD